MSVNMIKPMNKGKNIVDPDVTISESKYKDTKEPVAYLTFRNNACRLAKINGRVSFGPANNRLYIAFSEKEGFAVNCAPRSKTAAVRITNAIASKNIKTYMGNYSLMYDDEEQCHYIDRDCQLQLVVPDQDPSQETAITALDKENIASLEVAIYKSVKSGMIDALNDCTKDLYSILKNAVREGFEEIGK